MVDFGPVVCLCKASLAEGEVLDVEVVGLSLQRLTILGSVLVLASVLVRAMVDEVVDQTHPESEKVVL